MKSNYLIDVRTGQRFEYDRGGVRESGAWQWITVVSGTLVEPKHKLVSLHFSNWKEYVEGTWETRPSQQTLITTRLKELRWKTKLFKWYNTEDEFKGYLKVKSQRANQWDFVVVFTLLEDNLEIVEAVGSLK